MKKILSILAVLLTSLTANADQTIIWDYNTIVGIYYEETPEATNPVGSKNGIELYVPLGGYGDYPVLKDGTWVGDKSVLGEYNRLVFRSTAGKITSITITCGDTSFGLWEEEEFGWTTTPTTATWTGTPEHEVMLPLRGDGSAEGLKDITQITFTVDGVLKYAIKQTEIVDVKYISGIPDGWSANKDLNELEIGTSVVLTTANIPAGKKIDYIKASNGTVGVSIYLTNNGDGTWTLPSMPNCNLYLSVKYVDAVVGKYSISNIPNGWKVNGSTTSGTYEAEEGAEVIFTPTNIPAGKKIKSIKVVKE